MKLQKSFKNDVDVDFNNVIRTVHGFAGNDSTTVATLLSLAWIL